MPELIAAHHPGEPHAVTLTSVQLVIARHCESSSWAHHFDQPAVVELLEPLTA